MNTRYLDCIEANVNNMIMIIVNDVQLHAENPLQNPGKWQHKIKS